MVQPFAINARLIVSRYLSMDGMETCAFVTVAGARMDEFFTIENFRSLRFNRIPFFSLLRSFSRY